MMRTLVSVALSISAGVLLAGVVPPPISADAQSPAPRVSEPIVVSGDMASALHGASAEELWVWSWLGDRWQPVTSQLDERVSSGDFVTFENGAYDANDQLTFMADHLGAERPSGGWPPNMSRGLPAVEVRVTDPLSAEGGGHAYVIRGLPDPPPELVQLVSYDRSKAAVVSGAYKLGFAQSAVDGYAGLKHLSLFGDETDLLDRVKLRARVGLFPLLINVTEEDLSDLGIDFAPDPVAEGPVRVVLDAGGLGMGYFARASIMGDLGAIELPGGIQVQDLRISFDLSPAAVGSTYHDANVAGGVPVDGQPDSVPASPLSRWRELRFQGGRVVFVSPEAPPGSQARGYYKDDAEQDRRDTGDGRSYADNGVRAPDLDALIDSGFPGQMVFLRSDALTSATDLVSHGANPLQVRVVAIPTPTSAQPSPSPTYEPTSAIPSPSATGTTGAGGGTSTPFAERFTVYAPLVQRSSSRSGGAW